MAYAHKYKGHWYVRFKNEAGKWCRTACGRNTNRADAEFLARTYSAQELNRHHKAPVRMIDADLVSALTEFKNKVLPISDIGIDKQESSTKREEAAMENVIAYLNEKGILRFAAFDEATIKQYLQHRAEDGMSPRTRREELRLIKKFCKWAVKQHFLSVNPSTDVRPPKKQPAKPRYFSEDELARIFEGSPEPYRTVFRFLYLTGLRSGELANLEWTDYNRKLRTLIIRVVAQDKESRTPGNKTKREGIVRLNAEAVQILETLRKLTHTDGFIFHNEAGNRLDNDNIYRNLKRVLTELEIRGGHPHTFRHSFASHLVILGVSLYIVRDLMRHKSIRETEIYAHLAPDSGAKAVEVLSTANLKKEEPQDLRAA